ncbi:TIM-barrel domain-containing protein [Leptolyngbya sp. AN03gr2]|uniref:glycoside hydrolase family 31 protein n=1 Tax=unclassified Leptolyngbya TaxID=2650499 RepID=UPI003D320815
MPAAFFYSRQRDRFEQYYLPQPSSKAATLPGKLLKTSQTQSSVRFEFEQATLEITFLAPDFVRINWMPGLAPIPYAIDKHDWDSVEIHLAQMPHEWIVSSSSLNISVSVDGGVVLRDQNNQILRQELPPQRQDERWIHQAKLQPEEHIYGLGERASSLNLRSFPPKTYQMWNSDPGGRYTPGTEPLYLCIPTYLGLHNLGSYLVFYENSFRAQFTFDELATADFEGGSLRYYIAVGEPAHLLDRYTQLTGRAPLPARWTLGYHQSRWGYRTEEAIRQEVRAFQTHNLPLSAVHLDIDCQVGHRPFTIDPDRFPNLNQFTQELAQSGVKFVAINNPGVKYSRQSNLFLEGQILNAFCTYPTGDLVVAPVWAGRKAFPDFTNPKVRAWWSRQYAYLLDVGVAGFWHDMNEPAAFVSWGDPSLPRVAQHDFEGRGGDHREAHNLYALLEAKAAHESLRQYRPQQRPFIVSRSGWASLQRYAWTWTGDTASTWGALRQTISTIVGLGLSGIPYSGPDIGGFQGNPSAELYLRWFQMAAFLPFYRTHSSTSVMPRAPWTYGEPYLSIMRQFLELRYQLMPYFYTLAWQASQTGAPIVRPLFWQDWTDSELWDIEDVFCLGDALCVCPIVQPNETVRQVHLPKGHWYSFWNDTRIEGGTTVSLSTTLEQIPLLIKAGTILPVEVEQQLILHLYPPEVGESESYLYSDAGDGYGASRVDRFRLTRNQENLELTWEASGQYDFPYPTLSVQVHGTVISQAWLDSKPWKIEGQTLHCSPFQSVRFRLSDLDD